MNETVRTAQVALTSSDVAATVRLYSELFGFVNGGGMFVWGERMRMFGLDPAARTLMWWLVGRQKFFQLEIFHFTNPGVGLKPADWRPCDHGWTRLGVEVSRYENALSVLDHWNIPLIGQLHNEGAPRRTAFRDPYIGCVVELIEASGPRPDGHDLDPVVSYVTCSVSDLEAARRFYGDFLNLPIKPLTELHGPEHEALWGLGGALREGFVVDSGTTKLEIVSYTSPTPAPRPLDYRTTDQGILNVALGARDPAIIEPIVAQVQRDGYRCGTVMRHGDALAVYLLDEGREIEIIAVPEAFDAQFGFLPAAPFANS